MCTLQSTLYLDDMASADTMMTTFDPVFISVYRYGTTSMDYEYQIMTLE